MKNDDIERLNRRADCEHLRDLLNVGDFFDTTE